MSRIALVTAKAAQNLDEDMPPLHAALVASGAQVQVTPWDDDAIDWSQFDLAVLRSTWDYTLRLPEFLAWAERATSVTQLRNPLDVLRWNTDKHYLGELAQDGVATVSSTFIEPGEEASDALRTFLAGHSGIDEYVVKPAVGAGSRDAHRYHHQDLIEAVAHARRLLDGGRSVLLQPYLDHVDEHGETSMIFFAGRYSHSIRKGPLLKRKSGPVRALFAAEHISTRTPTEAERSLATQTLAAIPFPQPLLYARVDVIHDAAGAPRLLELELTEPSLFFKYGEGAAQRFAEAVLAATG
jgi:glutathione synthase/RimK-type ligase-like ATP-grasp enzyme